MKELNAPSVSELVVSIKNLIEEDFSEVMVQGEVSNLSPSAAGHWYFTLSDQQASLSCALFKGDALRNPLIRNLKDGDKIVVLGPVSVYQKKGNLQILAKRLMPAGEGALKLHFERLKNKLAAEGIFDIEKKKPVPLFPKRIAVITAEHGAALADFLNVIKRRSLWFDIVIIPAVVQGEDSPRSLIAALNKAQSLPHVDVIVLTRGGGSMEDLWSFNDEALVRTISKCSIPVISAVGHQVDFTLSDYVADKRCETPTAAAEVLSQPQTEIRARLNYCFGHLKSELFKLNQHVQLITQKFHPRSLLLLIRQKVQDSHQKLLSLRLPERGRELIGYQEETRKLDDVFMKLNQSMNKISTSREGELKRLEQVLTALNPSRVLGRGYSYVRLKEGKVIGSLAQYNLLEKKSKIELYFGDGVGVAIKE